MKIANYFAPIALMLPLILACSTDEERVESGEGTVVGNSDVEVKLSVASGVTTRASVESDENGLFELDNLGIFMLGTDHQNTNPDEKEIDWRPNNNPYAAWMSNVESQAVINVDKTEILWTDGVTRWYPIGNWYSYRFYGYYPRVNESRITTEKTKITVSYDNLDGKTDVIWGSSLRADMTDAQEKYRYSARYFRQLGFSEKYPEIAFGHKLMRLQFYIQGLEDPNIQGDNKFSSANTMSIDTIIVKSVPTHAELTLADLNIASNEGKIVFDWSAYLKDLGVVGDNDGEFVKSQIHDDDIIKAGQPLLLPVPDVAAAAAGYDKYRVQIRLRNEEGVLFDHEKPIDLNLEEGYKFEAGKTYAVILKIAGPKQVSVRANLSAWEEVKNGVSDLIFD